MAVNAYFLINVEPAKTQAVFEQLSNIPGAVVDKLLGPYDIVMNIGAATQEDLPTILRNEIRPNSPFSCSTQLSHSHSLVPGAS